jgi:hypothetical protein
MNGILTGRTTVAMATTMVPCMAAETVDHLALHAATTTGEALRRPTLLGSLSGARIGVPHHPQMAMAYLHHR